jgi:multiple sugar transport system substrate-binding protein
VQVRAVLLAAALMLAPLGAGAADLVVWWEEGITPQEDEAVVEIVAAFKQKTGKKVEATFYDDVELPTKLAAALEAGRPPDFAFGSVLTEYTAKWALDDRLADLSEPLGPLTGLFDPDALARAVLPNTRTGRKALYALPTGRTSNYIHVWRSLLEQAGFTLSDIPRDWQGFWSFWCDTVQPAVRRATGRDDIYGVGLPMSARAFDTLFEFHQFMAAYEADYVTPDGELVLDNPEVRRRLAEALDGYVTIHRKGCTPPASVDWDITENNKAFLAQTVVMTPNLSLSIPSALKVTRPEDYHRNAATIDWPDGIYGQPLRLMGEIYLAVIPKDGRTVAAEEFVRFLVTEGWLAHYFDFSGDRWLPVTPALLDQPFWLDPGDPHRMAAAMQAKSQPLEHDYPAVTGDWRHERVEQEFVWAKAVHQVAAKGVSPEQAVDEAIARIKQILSE